VLVVVYVDRGIVFVKCVFRCCRRVSTLGDVVWRFVWRLGLGCAFVLGFVCAFVLGFVCALGFISKVKK
jgi:hypothetical protein